MMQLKRLAGKMRIQKWRIGNMKLHVKFLLIIVMVCLCLLIGNYWATQSTYRVYDKQIYRMMVQTLASYAGQVYVLVIYGVWQFGSQMLIFLAAIKDVPVSLHEAAIVDGASPARRFFKVTLPMLTPSLFFNLVNGIIGSLQAFNSAYLVTNGGPMNATLFYGLYQYQQAFQFGNMGYASAMAWFWMLIIVLLTALVFKSSSAWVFYQDDRA